MPFLVVQPLHQPLHPPTYYASLDSDRPWKIVPPGGTRPPWSDTDSYPIFVPFPNAGQGYLDEAGQWWLYAIYTDTSDFHYWAATYDFATDRAVPRWTVSGAESDLGGIGSAVADGAGGFYAVTVAFTSSSGFSGPNWIVHYAGSGPHATASTTDWTHAWDIGTPPTLPFYANGVVRAIWALGGVWYAWVLGEYNAVWTSGGHSFIASLWTSTGDPTDAGSWTFYQYLSHWDMGATTFRGYWGEMEEFHMPWIMPTLLGGEIFFGTGMNIRGDASDPPLNTTVVWRLYPGDPPSPDLAVPMPGPDDETWGGPLAVYAGELYWAQFTHPHSADWAADSGTITLWRRRLGGWEIVSSYSHALYNTFYSPLIATMIPSATGLWLLFNPGEAWFAGHDPAPRIWGWNATLDTWGVVASTLPGDQYTPRIWPRYTP